AISSAGRESRAFATVFRESREATFVVDAGSGVIRACNRSAERLFGHSSTQMVGRPIALLCPGTGAADCLARVIAGVVERGGVTAMGSRMSRSDGSTFAARHRVVAIDTPEDDKRVLWLVRDADEYGVAARNEVLERDLFRIGAASDDSEERWLRLLERVTREFDWEYAEVWAPGSRGLAQAACWLPDDTSEMRSFARATRTVKFTAGEGLPGRVWQSGGAEWLSNVHELPERVFRRSSLAQWTGLTTFCAAPVRLHGDITHVVAFAGRSSRRRDPEVLALTEQVCCGIAQFVADRLPPDGTGPYR
ncbi:MAG TPA: PAS domain S-box protein, partial [Arenicellales bacterium]|nr:PAS domain S-box protein [Arenicellales bacterium]